MDLTGKDEQQIGAAELMIWTLKAHSVKYRTYMTRQNNEGKKANHSEFLQNWMNLTGAQEWQI